MRECSPPTICHMSGVTCHVSHVMCEVSLFSLFFWGGGQSGGASLGRVCYQRGLPCLVYVVYISQFPCLPVPDVPTRGSLVLPPSPCLHLNECQTHCTLRPAHCTLHTKHGILHTAYCPLHSAQCTVLSAQCSVHSAQCTPHNAHCTLHTSQYTLHTTHCILHTTH